MPTTPEDLRNLDIPYGIIFEKTCKNFEEATKRDTVDRCFDKDHIEKDKILIVEVDNDVDPSQEDEEITVDVNSVVEVIGEKKRRPKLELPNDHNRKRPKLHIDHERMPMEKIPSKMDVGVKGKMDTKIDPSLHEQQRKLKRARIADDLNDKLSHRPGLLELVQGNILQTDNETFKTALQAGPINFNETFDEDSNIPAILKFSVPGTFPITFTTGTTLTSVTGVSGSNAPTSCTKLSPITTQSFSVTNTSPVNSNGVNTVNGGKFDNRKKSNINKNRPKKQKPVTQSKTKVFKFHEFKGSSNVVKTRTVAPSSITSSETPYHIMIQQQQLCLQWQLEFQSKNPGSKSGHPVVVSSQQVGTEQPGSIQVQTGSPGAVPLLTSPVPVSSPGPVNTQTSLQGQPELASPLIVVQQPMKPAQTTIIQTQPQVQVHTQLQGQPMVQAQPQVSLLTQPRVQVQSSGPSAAQVKSSMMAKPASVVTQLHSSLPVQTSPVQSKPFVQTKTIIHGQPSVQLQSIIPGKQHEKTTRQRAQPVLQNTKNSSGNINKPLMNLEDMKVADLRAELKKRNLTVSGRKPELIEKLKPYLDINIAPSSNTNNRTDMKKLPVHVVENVQFLPMSSSPLTFYTFSQANSSAISLPATITLTTVNSVHTPQPTNVTSPPIILEQTTQASPNPSLEEILQQQIAQLQKKLEECQHQLQHNNPRQTTTTWATPQPASPQQIHQVVQQPTSPAHGIQLTQNPTSPQIQLIKQPTSPPQLQQNSLIMHQPLSPPQLPQQVQVIQSPVGQQHTLNTIEIESDGKATQQPATKMLQIAAPQTISLVNSSGQPLTIPVVSQGMQSILMPNLMDKTTKQNLENFVVSHGLNRSLNISTKPSTIVSSSSIQQPFVGRTNTLSPINDINPSKPASVPSSPEEGENQIMRTASNPFLVPMRKEPPNYDDAFKNLANKGQNLSLVDNNAATKRSVKSQAMDDVLEILIRNGELPPSAAQEPPPTPKTQTSMVSTATSETTVPSSQFLFSVFGGSTATTLTVSANSASDTTDVYPLQNGPITATPSVAVKKECDTPPPLYLSEPPDSKDLVLNINEMLTQYFTSMDWADDAPFNLDLMDTSTMQTDQDKVGSSKDILSVPIDENSKNNLHGSEPDLAALGINDLESVNMDVSDWLDEIMPSTGLTPLSANAPVQFPSDPILTPKTQQEVLDLFSFEDGEFGTPTDLQTGINLEKLTSSSN